MVKLILHSGITGPFGQAGHCGHPGNCGHSGNSGWHIGQAGQLNFGQAITGFGLLADSLLSTTAAGIPQ
jgi:hypothetical protein